jgi:hypothetical protein
MGQEKKITLLRVKEAVPPHAIEVAKQADLTVAAALADLAAQVGLGKDQKRIDRAVRKAREAAGKGLPHTVIAVRNGERMQHNDYRPFVCCDESGMVGQNGTPVAFWKGAPVTKPTSKPWSEAAGLFNAQSDVFPAPSWLVALHQDYGIHWSLSNHTYYWFWRKLTLRWTP